MNGLRKPLGFGNILTRIGEGKLRKPELSQEKIYFQSSKYLAWLPLRNSLS